MGPGDKKHDWFDEDLIIDNNGDVVDFEDEFFDDFDTLDELDADEDYF